MRIAWFTPLPPERSGIAAYSAELLPLVARDDAIVRVDESAAHDFVWKHQLDPYDLVVYQLGNAACHDYMWAYLVRYPGLVVLHDARLHQARARRLLRASRFDDYRAEFRYDHPDAVADFVEYAVEGLGGPIYYFWSMLRVVMKTARGIAAHNERVVDELRTSYPESWIDTIRMGVPPLSAPPEAAARVRRIHGVPQEAFVFASFGKVTPEKRTTPILAALGRIAGSHPQAHLLLVGDAGDARAQTALHADAQRRGVADRVHVTGFVPDEAIGDYLSAADACLCLRWPTALESSASWLRCLAAERATVTSDLAHLVDVPAVEARNWRATDPSRAPIAVSVDLVDEEESLYRAMERLVRDAAFRQAIAGAGRQYWSTHHTLEMMAADYRRILPIAAARPAPVVSDLPRHFTDDHGDLARAIASTYGVTARLPQASPSSHR